jgi:hypothetical protein
VVDNVALGQVFLLVRFQVLTAANMKMAAFWDVVPHSLIEIDRPSGPDDGGSKYL